MLEQIEAIIQKQLDKDALLKQLQNGLNEILKDGEIKASLEKALKGKSYEVKFAGLTLHFYSENSRKPFYRTRLTLIERDSKNEIAWYELEFGKNDEILDEYFDFIE